MKSPTIESSPILSPNRASSGSFSNIVSGFGNSSSSLPDPTSPQTRMRRKTVDKEKSDIYEELLKDPRNWGKLPRQTNFTKNFSSKPK